MTMKDKLNRTKVLQIHLKMDEFDNLNKRFSRTTCRKINEYAHVGIEDLPEFIKLFYCITRSTASFFMDSTFLILHRIFLDLFIIVESCYFKL
jgi:hypothetical protein